MFGLPEDFDGSFMVGRSLLQVCIGRHEVILKFDGNVEITIESEFRVTGRGQDRVFDLPPEGGAASLIFLQGIVSEVHGDRSGTLTLTFAEGRLELYDTSTHYESYQIRRGDQIYVV